MLTRRVYGLREGEHGEPPRGFQVPVDNCQEHPREYDSRQPRKGKGTKVGGATEAASEWGVQGTAARQVWSAVYQGVGTLVCWASSDRDEAGVGRGRRGGTTPLLIPSPLTPS